MGWAETMDGGGDVMICLQLSTLRNYLFWIHFLFVKTNHQQREEDLKDPPFSTLICLANTALIIKLKFIQCVTAGLK